MNGKQNGPSDLQSGLQRALSPGFRGAKSLVPVLTRFCDASHTVAHGLHRIIESYLGVIVAPLLGDLVAKGRVSIAVERCKACGFCVEFCPTHVLALSSAFNSKGYHPPHVVHPEKCSGCDLCGMYCPDFAINGTKVAEAKMQKASGGEK
jgi:2-oxoglutarate ferredoxin oxidoreductase subunit delta